MSDYKVIEYRQTGNELTNWDNLTLSEAVDRIARESSFNEASTSNRNNTFKIFKMEPVEVPFTITRNRDDDATAIATYEDFTVRA